MWNKQKEKEEMIRTSHHTHTKRFNYAGEHAPSLLPSSFLPLPHAQTRTNPGKRQCKFRYRAMFTTFVVLCLVVRETLSA